MTPHQLLDKAAGILNKKAADYTTDLTVNRYENFQRAELISGWFTRESDKPYAVLVGIKLARIASLLSENKHPQNEALEDSFMDAINYLALWAGSLYETDNPYDVAKKSDTKDLCPICFNPLGADPLNFTQIGGRLAHTACFEREREREQERKTLKG